MRYEETEIAGHIRIVQQDGTQVELGPQEALDLLHWLYQRHDLFRDTVEGSQPTAKLPSSGDRRA